MKIILDKEVPPKPNTKSKMYEINVRVLALVSLTKNEAAEVITDKRLSPFLKEQFSGKIYLSYPFNLISVELDIPVCYTIGEVLWHIAKAYKKIYERPKKYKIFGHTINELYFEHLTVYKNIADIFIGS